MRAYRARSARRIRSSVDWPLHAKGLSICVTSAGCSERDERTTGLAFDLFRRSARRASANRARAHRGVGLSLTTGSAVAAHAGIFVSAAHPELQQVANLDADPNGGEATWDPLRTLRGWKQRRSLPAEA